MKRKPAPAKPRRDVKAHQASQYFSILKGLAIIPVVVLHFFAGLDHVYTSNQAFWFITADQIGRFCVPLFVAVSAYGLASKYQTQNFNLVEFFRRRVFKLLPLYLVWSVVLFLCLNLTPLWHPNTGRVIPFWEQMLTGGADYHLYFVPMIFQLYLLFPLLFWLAKKWPGALLIAGSLLQLGLFWWYETLHQSSPGPTFFISDQEQYIFAGTWLAYFCLGLVAALPSSLNTRLSRLWWLVLSLTGLTLTWNIASVIEQISQGIDPIDALRFTRWPIFVYGAGVTWLLLRGSTTLPRWPKWLQSPLSWVGKYSYLIYLAHTLGLRILFGVWEQTVSWTVILASSALLGIGLVISKRLSR